jgi:hypothetical protein
MNNSLNFNQIWQRITTSRRTVEREADVQRENAQCENALREDFARRAHALESQIAQAHVENCRLRAENRALLNSVLGIAGIPPVIVADPPDSLFAGAQHGSTPLTTCATPGPPRRTCQDDAHSPIAPSQERCHSERSSPRRASEERFSIARVSSDESLFVSPDDLGAEAKRDPSSSISPTLRDDSSTEESVAPNGSASPGRIPRHPSGRPAPLQKQAPHVRSALHPRNDPHAIAPLRRRSWHQINRMLEFESSRRKDQDS